jgi:hypothetical protein
VYHTCVAWLGGALCVACVVDSSGVSTVLLHLRGTLEVCMWVQGRRRQLKWAGCDRERPLRFAISKVAPTVSALTPDADADERSGRGLSALLVPRSRYGHISGSLNFPCDA